MRQFVVRQALITSYCKILLKRVCLHSLSLIKIAIRISMRQVGEAKREQGRTAAGRATSATLQRLVKLYETLLVRGERNECLRGRIITLINYRWKPERDIDSRVYVCGFTQMYTCACLRSDRYT